VKSALSPSPAFFFSATLAIFVIILYAFKKKLNDPPDITTADHGANYSK
jgi:hypothetical protein